MPQKHLVLDIEQAKIAVEAHSALSDALLAASNTSATHVVSMDDLLLDHFIAKAHTAETREDLWEIINTDLYGQVDVAEVNATVMAAIAKPTVGRYPKNIAAKAKPVWDVLVTSDRFKKAIVGRNDLASYAVAVKWLNEACRRKGMHAFNDGDAGGKPDADLRSRMLRELSICKTYVEQVFRNMHMIEVVSRQNNWANTTIGVRGNLYRLASTKRIFVKTNALPRVKALLQRYEGFNGEDLIASPVPNGRVIFDVDPAHSELKVTLELQYTKAQLVKALNLDQSASGMVLLNAARDRLGRELVDSMRSVVASTEVEADAKSDNDQRLKAETIADLIIKNLAAGKLVLRKSSQNNSWMCMLRHKLMGSKPLMLTFKDNPDFDEHCQGTFIRMSRTALPKIEVTCNFEIYGLPRNKAKLGLLDALKSDLHTTLVHELIHLLDFKRTNGRDHKHFEKMSYPDGSDTIDNDGYFNNATEFNAYLQSMISKFSKAIQPQDFLVSFPKFYDLFKLYFKDGSSKHFLDYMNADTERRVVKRVYGWWKSNQAVTAAVKQLRALESFEAEALDGESKVKIPEGAVLLPARDEDTVNCFQIAHPPECFGKRVRFGPEEHQKCAHIDSDFETFDGSMEAAFELLVEEFNNLPTIRPSADKIIKVLGPVSTWHFAMNRSWMHNLNMKCTHPSLTFELMKIKEEVNLCAVYGGEW